MHKLIFLDIDGVLNNKNDGSSYYCMDPKKYGISKYNFGNLKYLLMLTNAKIVLSTSWRNHDYTYRYRYNNIIFKSPLKSVETKLKNDFFFVSKCPHISGSNKYEDILGFFYNVHQTDELNKSDFNFVVLDDARNQDLDKFGKRFFCIDIQNGLTKSDAEAIALYLNYEDADSGPIL